MAAITWERHQPDIFLDPLLPLRQIIAKRLVRLSKDRLQSLILPDKRMVTLSALPPYQMHLALERVNRFFVLQRGRRCGQAGKSPPIKMDSRSQWQVHLLAQSIHQRYQKPPERKGQDLSDGRTPLKRCPPVTHHCYLTQILLNHYPRLLAYPHEEANG